MTNRIEYLLQKSLDYSDDMEPIDFQTIFEFDSYKDAHNCMSHQPDYIDGDINEYRIVMVKRTVIVGIDNE